MSSKGVIQCDGCLHFDKEGKAEFICVDCRQAMCSSCKTKHLSKKPYKDHLVEPKVFNCDVCKLAHKPVYACCDVCDKFYCDDCAKAHRVDSGMTNIHKLKIRVCGYL